MNPDPVQIARAILRQRMARRRMMGALLVATLGLTAIGVMSMERMTESNVVFHLLLWAVVAFLCLAVFLLALYDVLRK